LDLNRHTKVIGANLGDIRHSIRKLWSWKWY